MKLLVISISLTYYFHISVLSSITRLVRTAENVEDNLIEKCYCPGDEYTKLFPELNEVVTKMANENAKMAEIYRPPVQTKDGIPDVNILKGIKSFSDLSRDDLQSLDFVDFVKLKISAMEEVCM